MKPSIDQKVAAASRYLTRSGKRRRRIQVTAGRTEAVHMGGILARVGYAYMRFFIEFWHTSA